MISSLEPFGAEGFSNGVILSAYSLFVLPFSNCSKGSKVIGGKEGIFIEKPDIVDKFCRREITDENQELGHLKMIHFNFDFRLY